MGTRYKPLTVVMVCFQNDIPVFGQISEILSYNEEVLLTLSLLKTGIHTFMHTKLRKLNCIMFALAKHFNSYRVMYSHINTINF